MIMANVLNVVLGLVVAVIVISSVAVPIINDTNTTGWSTTERSIFGNINVMLILGLFILAAGIGVGRIGG